MAVDAAPDGGATTPSSDAGEDAPSGRITAGLAVLYTFREGSGAVVKDVSGLAPQHTLIAQDANAAAWNQEGLTFSGTHARTRGAGVAVHCGQLAHDEVRVNMAAGPRP